MNTDNKLHLPNMEKYLNNQDPNIEQKVKVMMDKLDKEYTDKQPQTCYVENELTGLLSSVGIEGLEKLDSVYIHTPEELAKAFREVAEKAFDAGILIGQNEGYGAGMEAHEHNEDAIGKDEYLNQHYPLPQPINTKH